MTKPVILQVGPYPDWDQAPLDTAFDVRRLFEAEDKSAFLARHGGEVRAIATRGELGADADMIAACPNLELISVYGVGYDAVDLEVARERDVRVTNTPDVLTGDVADLGVAMMFCLSRGMIGAEAWVRDGSWANEGLYPLKRRVFGRRAGILGLGRIGFEVGKRLAGFGMDIAYSDLAPREDAPGWTFMATPRELAEHSDFFFVNPRCLCPNSPYREPGGNRSGRFRRYDHQHIPCVKPRRRCFDRGFAVRQPRVCCTGRV